MDKYLHLRGCQTPWRYEGDCWGSSFQGKRWISWGAVVLQQQAGLVGSFCSSSWVVLRKIPGFGGWRGGVIPQHLPGNPNTAPLMFGLTAPGPWLPPVMDFHGRMRRRNAESRECAQPLSWDTLRKGSATPENPFGSVSSYFHLGVV